MFHQRARTKFLHMIVGAELAHPGEREGRKGAATKRFSVVNAVMNRRYRKQQRVRRCTGLWLKATAAVAGRTKSENIRALSFATFFGMLRHKSTSCSLRITTIHYLLLPPYLFSLPDSLDWLFCCLTCQGDRFYCRSRYGQPQQTTLLQTMSTLVPSA